VEKAARERGLSPNALSGPRRTLLKLESKVEGNAPYTLPQGPRDI